jgi:hypothetical protein
MPPALDFVNGFHSGNITPGTDLFFRIAAPADAARLKFTATNSASIEFRLEQGTFPNSVPGGVHWQGGPGWTNASFNQFLRDPNSWPWQPGRTYYLRVINRGGAAEPFTIQMAGRTLLTDDEDQDGMLDAWERQHFNTTGYNGLHDFDGDGLTNLVEYAFGLDPADAGSLSIPPPVLVSGGRYRFEFSSLPDTPGVTIGAEYSIDAVIWTPIPDTGSGNQHVFVTPAGLPGSRLYVRWKITAP